jgi:peptidoglycan/xylan/chitin deacetylase (PgdA/CDA1 family)
MTADRLTLCYHAVSETWEADLAVTPGNLRRQLNLLLRLGYRGTTFSDCVLKPQSARVFAVTFDDGFRSVVEIGFPIMEELGVPGTVFIPTLFPASGGGIAWAGMEPWLHERHRHELRSMSWSDARGLAEAGWEVGSHTVSHARLPDADEESLRRELLESRLECERQIGVACHALAYPYGAHDRRVRAAAGRAGYLAAATLAPGAGHRPSSLAWPRVGVYRKDAPLRFGVKVLRPRRGLASGSVLLRERFRAEEPPRS